MPFQVPEGVVPWQIFPWRHSAVTLPQGWPGEATGHWVLWATVNCRVRCWRSHLCIGRLQPEAPSNQEEVQSYNVTPVPSTDKAEHLAGAGKGKIFKGPHCIFTEQPKRMDVELRGSKLIPCTGMFVPIPVQVDRGLQLFLSYRRTFYSHPVRYFNSL